MNINHLIVMITLTIVVMVSVLVVFQYEACRLKFPDIPAWACIVKP